MKIKTVLIFLIIMVSVSLVSLAQRVKNKAYNATLRSLLSHSVKEIDVKTAASQKETYLFLDARTERENEVSYIPGAVWIGDQEFSLEKLEGIDRNRPIIVYCSVGYRSEKITEKLQQNGFKDVSNLYGGIFEWVNEGQGIVNADGATNKIHAYSKTWGIWLKKGEKVYK